jgi:hypothetical protein
MSRSKPPRKQYRPRPVNLMAHTVGIGNAGLLRRNDQTELARIAHTSMQSLVKSEGTTQAWANAADALNCAEHLSRLGICSDDETKALIAAGQRALAELYEEYERTGVMTCTPPQRAVLWGALVRHKIQLTLCSFGEFARARERVSNITRQALRQGRDVVGVVA